MKIFKKAFAVLLCLALILGTLPVFAVSAATESPESIPAPVDSAYVIDSFDGVTVTHQWGQQYGWIADRSFGGLTEPDVFDWSTAGNIEFDMYIENYENFKAAIEANPNFYFVLGSGGYGYDSRNTNYRSVIVMDTLITKSGWNHVKVPTSSFTAHPYQNSADRTATKYFNMRWNTKSTDYLDADFQDDTFVIANVCATMDDSDRIPAANKRSIADIYKDYKFTVPKNYAWCMDNGRVEGFTAVDASKANYIEFDFYVSDYDKFVTMEEGMPIVFVVQTKNERFNYRVAYRFGDQVKNEGWNHIILTKTAYSNTQGSPDWTQVTGLTVGFWTSDANLENPGQGMILRYANVCGTETDGKTVSYAIGTENNSAMITYEPNGWTGPDRTFEGNTDGWRNNYRIVRRDKLIDFSKCTQLQFTLYIESATAYEAWREHIFFIVADGSGNWATYPAPKGLVSGNNTITIDFDVIARQSVDISQIEQIGLRSLPNGGWWNTKPQNYNNNNVGYTNSSIANFKFAMTNVIGIIGERANTEDELYIDAGIHSFWGNRATNFDWCKIDYTLASGVDVSDYDYVEFDVLISDADALREEKLSDGTTNRWTSTIVHLGSDSSNKKSFEFNRDEFKTGLNHIRISVEDLGDYATDLKYIRLNSERYNDNQIPSHNYCFGIYNIKATKGGEVIVPGVDVPAMQNVNTMVDSEKGLLFETTLAAGENTLNKGVVTLTDALKTTTGDYIEMDVYVSSDTDQNLCFWVSSNGTSAATRGRYELGLLKAGWNHVVLDAINYEAQIGGYQFTGYDFKTFFLEKAPWSDATEGGKLMVANLAVTKATATVDGVYSNNMVLQQNEPINVTGAGTPGVAIKVEILDAAGTVIRTATTTAGEDNKWMATLDSIKGGYDKYSMKVYLNNTVIKTVSDIRFGEVFVAAGQSNMDYKMWETKEGAEKYYADSYDQPNITIYTIGDTYWSGDKVPYEPAKNHVTGSWVVGNTKASHNVSAVAYYYAEAMQKKLDVPVGVMTLALGSSSIFSWISREYIENDAELLAYLKLSGKYLDESSWNGNAQSMMSAMYNIKAATVEDLSVAGMIWYQGCNEVGVPEGVYTNALKVLRDCFEDTLNYEGDMPFTLVQLAPYGYSGSTLPKMWDDMTNATKNYPNMGQVTIYDLPLDWNYADFAPFGSGGHPIHPMTKRPVGERLAEVMYARIYDSTYGEVNTPVWTGTKKIEGKYVYVDFDNVGDGLASPTGTSINGFSVAGADGVFVNAQAEVVDNNTVKVWSDVVAEPRNVAYAYDRYCVDANLYSTQNGGTFLPAAPFISTTIVTRYPGNTSWMNVDSQQITHFESNYFETRDAWTASGATAQVVSDVTDRGAGALKISYNGGSFYVAPTFNKENGTTYVDYAHSWVDYNGLAFKVKNTGSAVTLDKLAVYSGAWYYAEIDTVLSADSGFVDVKADFTKLTDANGNPVSASVLTNVTNLQVVFSDAAGAGAVYVDTFQMESSLNPDNVVPELNNTYATVDVIEGVNHTIANMQPGVKIYQNYTHYFKLPRALSTTGGEYIEFDVFFSTAPDQAFTFWVSDNRESGNPRARYTVEVLEAGWTHVVINALSGYATSGSGYNFQGYNFSFPFLEHSPYSENHATGGTMKIANLSVTKYEAPVEYTFGHTMQLKANEPWGLFFNGIVYEDDTVVDYDTLSDYGMYIVAAEDLEGEATVENVVANGKVFRKGDDKVKIGASGDKAAICVTYDEALYTYEMDKEFYAVFFAADKNGNVSYGDVKTRSVVNVIDDYQGAPDKYSESLIALCDKMDAMYDVVSDYRANRTDRYEFNNAQPETVADYNFGATTVGEYTFGYTMQLATIEPWALVFNGAVRVNGAVIDYNACDEYGMILSKGEYDSAPSVEQLLTEQGALVYNNKNGGAKLKGDYISVDYMEGIYSSEMDKEFYAMFYVVIDGKYYYGNVKTRSMLSVAQQYFDNADAYQDDVIALLDVMVDLYEATVAYKESV